MLKGAEFFVVLFISFHHQFITHKAAQYT